MKEENIDLKKAKIDVDLPKKFDEKVRLCEKLKKEQNNLKNRMDNWHEFLQGEKQKFSKIEERKPLLGENEFTLLRKKEVRFIKPTCALDTNVICNYCYKYVHMKSHSYLKKMRKGMKSIWVVRDCTNSQEPTNK